MCNAFSIFFKCGHLENAQGIPCGGPDCPASFRQLTSHQVCLNCAPYEYMDMRHANMNQPAVYDDFLFERNFDIEMIDPEIYNGIAGVDERSISFEQLENSNPSRYQGIQLDIPEELDGGIQGLQIEAPPRPSFIYPPPVNPLFGWDHMGQVHQHPNYQDYALSPDEEDVSCAPQAPVMPSSSSYRPFGDSDMIAEYATPSPPFMPWLRNKAVFSSDESSGSAPLASRRPNPRELSPTSGTRGHETFLDAASAILDLPLPWHQNNTLREFLAEHEDGDSSEDEDEEEIDHSVPQFAKIRQPNFLRDDYDELPPLKGLAASTSGYAKFGTTQKPTPADTEDGTASKSGTVTRTFPAVKFGPYSLARSS
ncbi:hypothetical protein MferCBS31731_006018 [Microsporum ferrugineum]